MVKACALEHTLFTHSPCTQHTLTMQRPHDRTSVKRLQYFGIKLLQNILLQMPLPYCFKLDF